MTLFAGTAATAAGPHAGGSGTGDVVERLQFKGADTVGWLIDRHGALATLLGVLAVAVWCVRAAAAPTPRSCTGSRACAC